MQRYSPAADVKATSYMATNGDGAYYLASEVDARIAELEKALEVPAVWSAEEMQVMTDAFNRANEKHGWYETLMAIGAALLRYRASKL